ncbi:hypothetical protein FOA43_003951 [Brettanomyces nanus]|uniref:Endopolyphosphatase n=1 Tax=Eeniella nana TaxID=13502 RepID=A0A875S4J5_EENNA|nr:uncharacterized protein FOA43_003951 [Brettanomyces nanus]QPG76561.1 hypothetical protein FOA43_003951 [Brettanomyces nanus]
MATADSHFRVIVLCTFITLLTVLSVGLNFGNVSSLEESSSSLPLVHKGERLQVTQIQDDNEDEYKILGLTPNHSVRVGITDLKGNSIDTNSEIIYHGRFLHITDMHPDELNKLGSSIPKKCHKKLSYIPEDELCHPLGDAMSGCDSPMQLYEDTLAWIRKNLKDKIDFVIWTGDNVRHDNDRGHPRLEGDIFKMNQNVANKMAEVFMDEGEEDDMPLERRVKIIPSLGNNDVYPHNLVAPGPTLQTREMYKIWRDFVPAEQMHTFDRGIYFFREVIPGKLAVLSINTLYFFKSNPLSDNCDGRKQPGYKLFEWLSVTLNELRRRHMKVWLSGHVPPIPKNLHYSCYTKMAVWMHEYRDIIIGGLYGHMNTDHFVPLDSVKAWKSIKGQNDENCTDENCTDENDVEDYKDVIDMYGGMGLLDEDFGVTRKSKRYDSAPQGKVTYLEDIRDSMFARIKGKNKSGEHGDRYAFAHVTASVIPTFNPGFRIWEYNVTDLLKGDIERQFEPWTDFFTRINQELDESDELADILETFDDDDPRTKNYYTLAKDKTIPQIMPPGTPLGPGYVMQLFSPERYTQYYLDLDSAAKDPDFKLDYRVHYSTNDKPYDMDSLLVEDWMELARRLAQSSPLKKSHRGKGDKENKQDLQELSAVSDLWKTFIDRAFLSTGYQNFPFSTN